MIFWNNYNLENAVENTYKIFYHDYHGKQLFDIIENTVVYMVQLTCHNKEWDEEWLRHNIENIIDSKYNHDKADGYYKGIPLYLNKTIIEIISSQYAGDAGLSGILTYIDKDGYCYGTWNNHKYHPDYSLLEIYNSETGQSFLK